MRRPPPSPSLPQQFWKWLDKALFGDGEGAPKTKLQVGYDAEDVADRYLKAKGYGIVERNWKSGRGELDIVARQGEALVIVEVKSGRASDGFLPREKVDRAKQQQLLKLTEAYRKQQGLLGQGVRIDVVEVLYDEQGRPQIEHFEGAVREGQR